jgi:hypothetical protein
MSTIMRADKRLQQQLGFRRDFFGGVKRGGLSIWQKGGFVERHRITAVWTHLSDAEQHKNPNRVR